MGTAFIHKCNKCGYKAMTSGGHDFGLSVVSDTYTCKSCEKIVEVTVHKFEHGVTNSKDYILIEMNKPLLDLRTYACPECGSGANLVKWDETKRPCPKCDGNMEKDLSGNAKMHWD